MSLHEELRANQMNWDERATLHVTSYDTQGLVNDPTAITHVVSDDQELMRPHLPNGSVSGLSLAHLQCHIGTDSLSWARLGADVTGIDFSGTSIAVATDLARQAGVEERTRFIQSTVDDASDNLGGLRFDIVYTSVGVLCWLPDLQPWAHTIASLLKPGGLFFIHEIHPMLNALEWDASLNRFWAAYPYFATGSAMSWDDGQDYSSDIPLKNSQTYEWPHSLEDIIGNLLAVGLSIESFKEHRSIEWKYADGLRPVGDTPRDTVYVLKDAPEAIPLCFSLAARAAE